MNKIDSKQIKRPVEQSNKNRFVTVVIKTFNEPF